MIPNGVMNSPCSYVLFPGAVITGSSLESPGVLTVIVNVAVTASFTPSSAVIVAV